jgi:hypothetical protein
MKLLHLRYAALENDLIDDETRSFLYDIQFDYKGRPLFKGNVAGVDACFTLKIPNT